MKTGFTQLKDTDRLILLEVDDRTLLEILKVNKNLLSLGEETFKKRMELRYPVLAKLKPSSDKWAKYYLDMVYYINKLKEDYGIDYIPVSSFDPLEYYFFKTNGKLFYAATENVHISEILAELGDEKRIRDWMNKKPTYKDIVLAFLLKYKNIPLFEKLYVPEKNDQTYNFKQTYTIPKRWLFLEEAAESGDASIITYVMTHFPRVESPDRNYETSGYILSDIYFLSLGAGKGGISTFYVKRV